MEGVTKHIYSKHSVDIRDDVLKRILGLGKNTRIEYAELYSNHCTLPSKNKNKAGERVSIHKFSYKTVEKDY